MKMIASTERLSALNIVHELQDGFFAIAHYRTPICIIIKIPKSIKELAELFDALRRELFNNGN